MITMKEQEATKAMEISTYGGAGYGNLCSMSDCMGNGVGGELGFLEMLGLQEFQIPTTGFVFEEMPAPRELMSLQIQQNDGSVVDHHQVAAAAGDGFYGPVKVMMIKNGGAAGTNQFEDGNNNAPGTPNSSSISLASNNGLVVESEQEEEGSGKSKKELKAKKKKLKKPRFAFMTKSEVDHLEDGYRWRKYGQKAVKNSPFPRSYYRCTSSSCGVKKRVERSCTDPSIVVTTYEGQHTHPSPLTPRSISSAIFHESGALFTMQMNLHSHYYQQLLRHSYFASSPNNNYTSYLAGSSSLSTSSSSFVPRSSMAANMGSPNYPGSITDHGLLQDLIPKEE